MFPFLIATKLQFPPLRPGLLARQRLLGSLFGAPQTKLILVTAPAGSGKTTLLSTWAASCDQAVAWLSVDEGDNDPVRFLSYVIAACQRVAPQVGQSTLEMLQASPTPDAALTASSYAPDTPSYEQPLAALVHDLLQRPAPLWLVLDDYHLIQSEAVHQMVRFLLDHQPAQMKLVISTRQEPPLHLPRLRARDQMVEIGKRELNFTLAEAAAFFDQTAGLHLPPEVVAALETRTEGWIAGLQLAALSLRNAENIQVFIHTFAGDNRQVMDYLTEEVFQRQPARLRDFLLQTAILNRLSGPLCDAVLGEGRPPETSQSVLEQLETAQLFVVPLDNRREWFRYHHLFQDFLRARLQKEYPQRLTGLHLRASRWFEDAGDVDTAVEHAFAAPDMPRVAYLLEQYGGRLLNGNRLVTLLNWFQRIPPQDLQANAYLCVGCSWVYVLSGQIAQAEDFLRAAPATLAAYQPHYIASEGRIVTGEEIQADLAAVQAFCARMRGDAASTITYSQQALKGLPAADHTSRGAVTLNLGLLQMEQGNLDEAKDLFAEAAEIALRTRENRYVAATALNFHGSILKYQGALDEAAGCYRQIIALETDPSNPAVGVSDTSIPDTSAAAMGHLGLAEIHFQRNQLAEATQHLKQALQTPHPTSDVLTGIYLLHAQLSLLTGDLLQAESWLNQADATGQENLGDLLRAERIAVRGAYDLARGDIPAAARLVTESALPIEPRMDAGSIALHRLPEYGLAARVWIAQGRPDRALSSLEATVAAATAKRSMVQMLEATLLQAAAHRQQRNTSQALQSLARAIDLAEPEGYVHPFLSAGEPVEKLLRQAVAQDIRTAYAQKVLSAFRSPAGERGSMVEPLTERERQILRLLAAGLSSTEIAGELVIAVSTVRSYIKVLYRKLDAHGRDQAVDKGRHMGLI